MRDLAFMQVQSTEPFRADPGRILWPAQRSDCLRTDPPGSSSASPPLT
jgi:hypothetical protein